MNKVNLLGRLTKDPDLRYTQSNNVAVCNFTLAVNRRVSKDGEKQADFISIQAWQKTAEFVEKYFKKGQQVAVSGRISTRTWEDDGGIKRYVTEVTAEEVFFADSKKDDNANGIQYKSEQDDSQYGPGFYTVQVNDELPF